MSYRAVVFDLGGVVLGSPIHAIQQYERDLGLERNAINRVVATTAPTGAWSRLERGELTMDAFYTEFEADCRDAGHEISARRMFELMSVEAQPRPEMLEAIRRIRDAGLRVAALTNNWANADEDRSKPTDGTRELSALFHVFIESSVEGMRKPDPRIYQLACTRLEVSATETVFLDDIGSNLKPARELGFHTIKVDDPSVAIGQLASALGFALG